MPTNPHDPIRIRQSDTCPPGGEPFNPDHCTTALDMRTRIATLERENTLIKSAFVLNDLNLPDYEGHRKAHLQLIKAADLMDKYKQGIVTRMLGWATVFVLGLAASGLWTQLGVHIK